MPFWKGVGGSAANSFASGNVYNHWRGTYAPGNVTGTRMGIGAAQQFGGPIGSLAGWLANKIYSSRNPDAQRFDNQLATDNIIGPQREALNAQLMRDAMGRQYTAPTQGPVQDVNWTPQMMRPQMGGWMSGQGGSIGNTNLASLINRQQFPTGPLPTSVNDVNWTPQAQTNLSFRGADGTTYGGGQASQGGQGWAGLASGGASQGGGIGTGWTGVGGAQSRDSFLAGGYQGAQSAFGGLRAGSEAEQRAADMAAMRRNRT